MGSMRNCLNSLQELQNSGGGNGNGNQSQPQQQQQQISSSSHFDHPTHDDFLDQMLLNLPSWTDNHNHHNHHHQHHQHHQLTTGTNPKSPWDINPNNKLFNIPINGNNKLSSSSLDNLSEDPNYPPPCDDSTLLASRLRQHQISPTGNSPKSLVLQQQLLLSAAAAAAAAAGGGGMSRSPSSGSGMGTGDNSLLFPLPLTLGNNGGDSSDSRLMRDDSVDAPFKSSEGGPVQALFNGLTGGGLPRTVSQVPNQQQHFHHTQTGSISTPTFGGGPSNGMNQSQATVSAGGGTAPTRQKVRARRGQATDPHSIAERLRRERIAERMKALQELVPNANKTDKASMLDEIIDYVKFLQLQVKVLSMSRLGGAAAVAPLVADVSSEGGGDCIQANGGGLGRNNNGTQMASTNDSLSVTEHQVAKLMEEDMGSAMQYLQGKGLCLMPISLATAISSATSHSRNVNNNMMNPLLATNADGPASPSMSVLTVQSATMGNGGGAVAGGGGGGDQTSVKDATSVSKP